MEGLDGNEAEEQATPNTRSSILQAEKRIHQSMISNREISTREVSSHLPREGFNRKKVPTLYIPKMTILIMAVGTRYELLLHLFVDGKSFIFLL